MNAFVNGHMHSAQSPKRFPSVAFKTVPAFVCLIMAFSRLFKDDRRALLVVVLM